MVYKIIIDFDDPSKPTYYIPLLGTIGITLIVIQLSTHLVKKVKPDLNNTMNSTLCSNISYPEGFVSKKEDLKFSYLVAFVFTRAAMWAKAPYLYTLFMEVHKFTMGEIGILYLIDAVAALIFGPLTGQLADKYGRKLFCHVYNISIIINLLLRMAGSRPLAYLAQIVTGLGAGLINTTFEAWLVDSAGEVFGKDKQEEKERFLKRIFKNTNIYDASVSIIVSGFCAIIYSIYGIYAPFWISIILSILAFIIIQIKWEENKPSIEKESQLAQFSNAFYEFKKKDVLLVGLTESFANAILTIYLFSWTPILKQSTKGGINVGFIFTCMVLTMIVGTKTYEVFIVHLHSNYYLSMGLCLFTQGCLFYIIFFVDNFFIRLLSIALINGTTGFYNPINSTVKSKILIKKYRALLMNIFRIPLNLYVIFVLSILKYMNPFTVAMITGCMAFVAFMLIIPLYIWPKKEEKKKPGLIVNEEN